MSELGGYLEPPWRVGWRAVGGSEVKPALPLTYKGSRPKIGNLAGFCGKHV